MKRPSTKVSRKDQVDTSKRGEMATVLIRRGPVDPACADFFIASCKKLLLPVSLNVPVEGC